ncbi:glycosyltransferase family 2 protein [Anoxybacillus sp. TBDG-1]
MIRRKISIIMPVYNGEKYLREAIDSVLLQTFKDYELIIVNDGSTDGTKKILETYEQQHSWIKVMHLKENKGVSHAINTAIDCASAEYICLVNADDIQYANRLEESYREIVSKNLDIVMSEFDLIDAHGQSLERSFNIPEFLTKENILLEEFKRNYFFAGACLIKFDRNIKFDANLRTSEDYDWFLRMLVSGKKVDFQRKRLLQVRIHKGSLSSDHRLSYEATKYIMNKYSFDYLFRLFQEKGFSNKEIFLTFALICIAKEEPTEGLKYINQIPSNVLNEYDQFCKHFYEGVLYGMNNEWENAHKCFICAMEVEKYKNAAVYNNLAVASYWIGKGISSVETLLQKALLYFPQYFDASENMEILRGKKKIETLHFTKRLLRENAFREKEQLIK